MEGERGLPLYNKRFRQVRCRKIFYNTLFTVCYETKGLYVFSLFRYLLKEGHGEPLHYTVIEKLEIKR